MACGERRGRQNSRRTWALERRGVGRPPDSGPCPPPRAPASSLRIPALAQTPPDYPRLALGYWRNRRPATGGAAEPAGERLNALSAEAGKPRRPLGPRGFRMIIVAVPDKVGEGVSPYAHNKGCLVVDNALRTVTWGLGQAAKLTGLPLRLRRRATTPAHVHPGVDRLYRLTSCPRAASSAVSRHRPSRATKGHSPLDGDAGAMAANHWHRLRGATPIDLHSASPESF